MKVDVGVVGLGRMGSAMASRLVADGHGVTVYNRTPSATQALAARGAVVAERPAKVARHGGLVISMLADEDAVREVCLGADGILSNLRDGTHLAMSTVSPAFADQLARLHEAAGVKYISAPVQGRPPMAEAGKLVGWLSGVQPDAAARTVLSTLCQRQIWLGSDVRHACAAKLALNFLMFANVEVLAEAMAYLEHSGVDRGGFAEGMTETMFPGPLFASVTAALLAGDEVARGSDVRLCVKDLRLLLDGLHHQDQLPVARRLEAVFHDAVERGLGSKDPVAVRHIVYPDPDATTDLKAE